MALRHKIKALGDYTAKRAIKQFAQKYHLVYFGRVDSRDEEYELVRGVTVSTTHHDNHYSVGTIDGHDIIFVERRNRVTFPGKPPTELNWQILQIDLPGQDLPRVFVDFHQHGETFYANLFAKLPQFKDVTSIFEGRDPALTKHGRIFGSPQHYAEIGDLLTSELTGMLVHNFRQFDFEFNGGHLYVYASKTRPSVPLLGDMARVGLWLAVQLKQRTTS